MVKRKIIRHWPHAQDVCATMGHMRAKAFGVCNSDAPIPLFISPAKPQPARVKIWTKRRRLSSSPVDTSPKSVLDSAQLGGPKSTDPLVVLPAEPERLSSAIAFRFGA